MMGFYMVKLFKHFPDRFIPLIEILIFASVTKIAFPIFGSESLYCNFNHPMAISLNPLLLNYAFFFLFFLLQ